MTVFQLVILNLRNRLLFLLIFPSFVFSQINTFQISGIVYYEMKRPSPVKSFRKIINAKLIFNKAETFFVYDRIGMDSVQLGSELKTFQKDGKTTNLSVRVASLDEKGYVVYRNFDTEKIVLRYTDSFPLDPYTVQDNWLPIKWTIVNEHRNILGYHAQKAIAQFRGRIYIAWFTREIPAPYGPWKLFGLPGLILEAHDTANVAVFKVKKICYPCDNESNAIQEPCEKKRMTMKENVFVHDYWMKLVGGKMNKLTSKNNSESFVLPKNPVTIEDVKKKRQREFEIVYEWEDFPGDTPNPFDKDSEVQQLLDATPDKSILIEKGIVPSDGLDKKGLETFPERLGIKK